MMKPLYRFFTVLFMAGAAQAGWVTERPAEFLTAGDFDADGRTDIAIIDRTSGVVRIGFVNASGMVTQMLAAVSGVDGVEGVSVGRLLATNAEAIAVTAPWAARVNVVSATNRVTAASAATLSPRYALGLNQALAMDIGGAGNVTNLDDLFTTIRLNSPASPWVGESSRNAVGLFTNLATTTLSGEHVRGNVIRLSKAFPVQAAFVQRGVTDQIRVSAMTNPTPALKLQISSLPTNTHFAFGFFTVTGQTCHVMTYQPGGTQLSFHAVSEVTGVFSSAVQWSTGFAFAIGSVVTVEGTNQVAVLRQDGTAAGIYAYVPGSGLTKIQSLASSSGLPMTGLLSANGGLVVLAGAQASGRSEGIETLAFNGTQYVTNAAPQSLPRIGAGSGRVNVWAFSDDPLLGRTPQQLTALNAADWSSSFRTSGLPAAITVTGEVYSGTTGGLRTATSRSMGTMPAGGLYGMVNQVTSSISVVSLEAATGPQPGSVFITPAPGHYKAAIQVAFTSSPSMTVFYRPGLQANWTNFVAPFWLFDDTTVYFYGTIASTNLMTPLQTAKYTFDGNPEDQDADGDGVPDFVELAHGLDPAESGADGDGDGLTDLEELLSGLDPANADSDGDGATDLEELKAGTNPWSAASVPTADQILNGTLTRVDRGAAFDLYITPRPYVGPGNVALARTGTEWRICGMDGSLYGFSEARTSAVAGVTNPHVFFSGMPMGGDSGGTGRRLLGFLRESSRYPLSSTTNQTGRELVRIIVPPAFSLPSLNFTNAGGSLAVEASNWVQAATSQWATITRPSLKTFAGTDHTLAATLLEKKIEDLVVARALTTNTSVTLFPSRSLEGSSYVLSADDWDSLRNRTTNGWPAYDVPVAYTSMESFVFTNASTSITNLRHLARSLYRVSSTNESGYALPFDALRYFIRHGSLPGAYSNTTGMSTAALASAYAGVTNALNAFVQRPYVAMTLAAGAQTVGYTCTRLYEPTNGTPYLLVHSDGSAYDLAKSFSVISGTLFQVAGFLDGQSTDCTGTAIAVETIGLTAFVFASPLDMDGNLLADEWERLVFGQTGGSATNDADGDGYSDLQEYLDGTDPMASSSTSGGGAVSFALPDLDVAITGTTVSLSWSWPAAYRSNFQFKIQSATSLSGTFADRATVLKGQAETSITGETAATNRFYRVGVSLKP